MTTEKISEREHGKGHVTATTVPCKLQQWDRYCIPQNVFLLVLISILFNWSYFLQYSKLAQAPKSELEITDAAPLTGHMSS